ncbi:MAG: copper resistance protein CopA [Phycisphaerae bacterium]|nr:copper resistance protein CopA [Phycisphaerae bacterium]
MTDSTRFHSEHWTRRRFLGTGGCAALTAYGMLHPSLRTALAASPLGAPNALDATAPGGIDLFIERQSIAIGGRRPEAITINGGVPGPLIRMQEGREALIRVHNRLDESTSIHWHGILLPFTMDGVPGVSFEGIGPGTTFTYRYQVRQNGTYWYHSHSGLQEQLGHYGQLIIDPADDDPVSYDIEHSIVLSDWTDMDPHVVMDKLKTMEGYFNYQRPTLANLETQAEASGESIADVIKKRLSWQRMRMDPTDIADVTGATYKFLMNGKTSEENWTAIAKPGQRVRLRIANASALTYYDFRVEGLPMTVVQADGQNIEPVETDELRIAVAETYDVIVTLPDDRPRTIFAEAMDRSGFARGTIAPQSGLQAAIPERRRRPMLTMADMGMMHAVMGNESAETGSTNHGDHKATAGMEDAGSEHTKRAGSAGPLPTSGLPERIKHGPDTHGPGAIVMGKTRYRQLSDPGSGLGDDGRRVLTYSQLRCLETPPDRRAPTRQFDLHLTGNMHKYIWGFDGKKWSESEMIRFQYGERLRINMINDTMMNHPIHLHGMWMDLYAGDNYAKNPRKHTVNVQPAELLTVDITADAPGQWAFHCHVLYHMKMGMFRTVAVVRSLDEEATHAGS